MLQFSTLVMAAKCIKVWIFRTTDFIRNMKIPADFHYSRKRIYTVCQMFNLLSHYWIIVCVSLPKLQIVFGFSLYVKIKHVQSIQYKIVMQFLIKESLKLYLYLVKTLVINTLYM